jgi:hypothetical protein
MCRQQDMNARLPEALSHMKSIRVGSARAGGVGGKFLSTEEGFVPQGDPRVHDAFDLPVGQSRENLV